MGSIARNSFRATMEIHVSMDDELEVPGVKYRQREKKIKILNCIRTNHGT